ncbi:N-formylglutamate amidohydrolase [Sphingomicrobium clamense]|uniref:N-formylglutamate amidohydrolase n=1 Tax=Sphingomicrobium clamense TaxID=2851013 RepID=A0ABS6V490_9SPHN|nr:N-formylglutamate amidohydrolase [Sphingomicrobium sp. B8]MBW0144366.1 N-formylglutamate amidohydrolase [Sphingomicrobium sp. B8]
MRDSHWWTSQRGPGPVVATAIHDGHALRGEVAEAMKLPEHERLREEDPFTGQAVKGVSTHIIMNRSRFEVDINRARDSAVYRTPDMAWGLDVWDGDPGDELVERSLAIHDAYYANLAHLLDDIAEAHPKFCLLDVHSYNHRRDGADAEPAPQAGNPDINIGTFSMPREEWGWLLDPLIDEIASFDFAGRKLDVRENVAFQGKGEQTRFVHDRYPGRACAIAFEFKKIYMDEWTGQPDPHALPAMRALVTQLAQKAAELLDG